MRKTCVWLLAFLVIGMAVSVGAKDEPPRNVVLIGWDGAQRNHVKECLGRGELPNLKKLASEGTLVAIDILRVTDTKAGWTQILTGYEPEITGVFSNARYQPIPKGYTVFERLEKFFGADKFVTVAVIGKKEHVDNEGPQRVRLNEEQAPKAKQKAAQRQAQRPQRKQKQLKNQRNATSRLLTTNDVTEKQVEYRVIPGKPYYYTSQNMDVFINGLMLNDRVCSKTVELLEKYKDKPFFFFVHFAEVDHKGHQFGENSKEYNDALISSDACTGKIMTELKKLDLYDKTLIYVTADHGFDEGLKQHTDAPYVFLATNDPAVMRRGERADITPTILDRFGVDLSTIQPPLSGHPLTKPYTPPIW
jgi:predicted AlkP superfamily pyrophosphatase or phosphodiesterase